MYDCFKWKSINIIIIFFRLIYYLIYLYSCLFLLLYVKTWRYVSWSVFPLLHIFLLLFLSLHLSHHYRFPLVWELYEIVQTDSEAQH